VPDSGGYTVDMVTFAKMMMSRDLRQRSTFTEKIVWNMLRNRRMFGYRFKRQVVFDGFILDFFCNELRLAIEIDGPIHENQKEYDALRQFIIEQEDVRFIRVTTREIEESPEKLTKAIQAHIAAFIPAKV
jgi:very-short-patch-repair endonuclease